MKRILVLSLFVLVSCSKKEDEPSIPEGATVTKVEPVGKAESQAILGMIRFGHGIAPGQSTPPPAPACPSFVSQYPGFVAGTLEVPEDWDQPKGAQIQLFYYWRKGDGAAETRPPVVFFNGGPASDSHSSAEVLAALDFTKNSSFVFLDQRGTGCSTAFPTEISAANAKRLMKWGSHAIVLDSEALRKKLFGDRKWRVYGQSFGGFIVHRYLETAPEGIDRAVAHGASIMQDPVAWTMERVRSQHRVSDTYFTQFPDDKTTLVAARAAIPAKQCWKSGNDAICGAAVLDSLTILLGFHDSWPSLHQWVRKLLDSNGKVNATTLNSLVRTFVFGVYGEGGLAGDVISKMEIVPGYDDRTGCANTMDRLRKAGEAPDAWIINECRLLGTYQKPNFGVMNGITAQGISLDRVQENITQGRLRFFLYSGQQDVFVPFATFEEEVKHLGAEVQYESFPTSGHEGFYTEPHVIEAVTAP